jgi:hypothetical protein
MPSGVLRYGEWLIALSMLLGGCMDMTVHSTSPAGPTEPSAACLPGIQAGGAVMAYGCPAKQ